MNVKYTYSFSKPTGVIIKDETNENDEKISSMLHVFDLNKEFNILFSKCKYRNDLNQLRKHAKKLIKF